MQRNVESTFKQCISLYCIIYYPTSIIIGNNSESIKLLFMTASRLENSSEEPVNERVVCDVDCIIQPLGKTCRQPNCQASISYKIYRRVYTEHPVEMSPRPQWQWSSSMRCYSRNRYPFFVNNVLMASSILCLATTSTKLLFSVHRSISNISKQPLSIKYKDTI